MTRLASRRCPRSTPRLSPPGARTSSSSTTPRCHRFWPSSAAIAAAMCNSSAAIWVRAASPRSSMPASPTRRSPRSRAAWTCACSGPRACSSPWPTGEAKKESWPPPNDFFRPGRLSFREPACLPQLPDSSARGSGNMGADIAAGTRRAKAVRVALLLAGTALAGSLASGTVLAQPAPGATAAPIINVPAQPLSTALIAFSRQTRVEVIVPSSVAAGKRSATVNGPLTAQAALSQMLAGTGLSYRFTGAGTVTIEGARAASGPTGASEAGAIELDTITVAGATMARGGVSEI
ncbi:MAG: hypothetical protein C0447_15750, partial [Methylobacterium sp.]|nr:hypothetical protein [Methylobacterium sp.]